MKLRCFIVWAGHTTEASVNVPVAEKRLATRYRCSSVVIGGLWLECFAAMTFALQEHGSAVLCIEMLRNAKRPSGAERQ